MSFSWTDENTAAAAKLWKEGYSASRIASLIGGLSRNAVIGKLHRMGMTGHAPRIRNDGNRKGIKKHHRPAFKPQVKQPKFNIARPRAEVVMPVQVLTPPEKLVSLIDLERHHCRYPFTQPNGEHKFCGRNKHPGISYCIECATVVFRPEFVTAMLRTVTKELEPA